MFIYVLNKAFCIVLKLTFISIQIYINLLKNKWFPKLLILNSYVSHDVYMISTFLIIY